MKKVAGIDVSKDLLEWSTSGVAGGRRFQNRTSGHLRLLKKLQQAGVDLVVIESTGGYEKKFVQLLWAANLPVAVLNPRWVRDFAKSLGRYAKNDQIDSTILVLYGERMNPDPTPPIPEEIERLRMLLTRRGQLLDMLVMEKNHEKAPEVPFDVRKGIRSMRKELQKQIKDIDALIAKVIDNSPAIKPRAEKLQEQTGVGPVLMATLIADVPELGTVPRNVASALVGVAPFDDDSGKHTGKRRIAGGRARPRRALYMATLAAVRHDQHLKDFYRRLRLRGKPHKVALVACMRKLIVRLNSVLKANPSQHFLAA